MDEFQASVPQLAAQRTTSLPPMRSVQQMAAALAAYGNYQHLQPQPAANGSFALPAAGAVDHIQDSTSGPDSLAAALRRSLSNSASSGGGGGANSGSASLPWVPGASGASTFLNQTHAAAMWAQTNAFGAGGGGAHSGVAVAPMTRRATGVEEKGTQTGLLQPGGSGANMNVSEARSPTSPLMAFNFGHSGSCSDLNSRMETLCRSVAEVAIGGM